MYYEEIRELKILKGQCLNIAGNLVIGRRWGDINENDENALADRVISLANTLYKKLREKNWLKIEEVKQ